MRGKIKRILGIGAALLMSLAFGETVFAENELSDIKIEVELQEDGSGIVTEFRQMNMDDGTELFIVLEEMQDSELLDFSVAGFEEVTDWDSDDSREEKAGKYGVIETDDGLELVWGIGDYGTNEYEVTYTLSNLVRELEDGQALLWNFDTFSDIPAENLTVEISSPEPFTEDNVRFWGFGFDGDIQLVGNTIVWQAEEEVDDSNDVTVLLQFQPGLFNTQVSVEDTLEEQREMAMNGSAYNDPSDAIPIAIAIGMATIGGGAALGATAYVVKVNKAKKEAGRMRSGLERMKDNKGIVYEKIPYRGEDLAGIAYLLQDFQKGYFEDYFSAYLLKWVTEERIMINASKDDSIFGEEFDTEITIQQYEEERRLHPESFSDHVENLKTSNESYEMGLWLMLLDAANSNGVVGDDRIKKWAKKNAKEVETFANYLTTYSTEYLEREKLVSFKEIKVWGTKHLVAIASPEGDQLFDRLVQFDNYLEEIELEGFANRKNPFSVEEFLLWNILYARSEEITDQFKEMVPDPTNDDYGYDDGNFIYHYWYWNGMTGFRSNWSDGLASGGFYSSTSSGASGIGGATSFGGGAGAGGGGGGGAR